MALPGSTQFLPDGPEPAIEQELPLGFQRLDLEEKKGVALPGSKFLPDSPDSSSVFNSPESFNSPGGIAAMPVASPDSSANGELPLGFGFRQPDTAADRMLGPEGALGESDASESDGPLPLGFGMGMAKPIKPSEEDGEPAMEFASLRQLMEREQERDTDVQSDVVGGQAEDDSPNCKVARLGSGDGFDINTMA